MRRINIKLVILLVALFVLGFFIGRLSVQKNAPHEKSQIAENSLQDVESDITALTPKEELSLQDAATEITTSSPKEEFSQHEETSEKQEKTEEAELSEDNEVLKYVYFHERMPKFKRILRDLPNLHMEAARSKGLKEIPSTREDVAKDGLVLIQTCEEYMVDELTHSVPYLTHEASEELKCIGTAFQEILRKNSLPKYRIVVTSVLRTMKDVKRLRRTNRNASENSPHCYGTTFDISYVSFDRMDSTDRAMDAYELKKVLAKVLINERKLGHIYVKYERKQPCFHTTSRL